MLYNGGTTTVRPDLVGNPYANLPTDGNFYFNPAAFAAVPLNSSGVTTRAGTTHRNYLTGPGFNEVDLSTFKNFKFTERYTLQFRAEFFNLLRTIRTSSTRTSTSPTATSASCRARVWATSGRSSLRRSSSSNSVTLHEIGVGSIPTPFFWSYL